VLHFRVHGNQGNTGQWPQQFPHLNREDPQQYQQQPQQQQHQGYLAQHQFGVSMEENNLQRSDTELTAPLTEEEFKDLEILNFGQGTRLDQSINVDVSPIKYLSFELEICSQT
jgi:hypothetical protein